MSKKTNGTITLFKPMDEIEAKERLVQFVDHYRPLTNQLPCVRSFEDNAWDLRGRYFTSTKANVKQSIRFVKLDRKNQKKATEPFQQPYLDFSKSYALHLMARHNWASFQALSGLYLPVFRFVDQGLCMARPSEPPCITTLTADVCEAINAAIRSSNFKGDVLYHYCLTLNQFVKDLQNLGLCSHRFTWTGMVVRPEDQRLKVGPLADMARQEMLPSLEAMSAMAFCYNHAESLREKWPSAINGFLAGQPARLGECWFLKEDGWVETEVEGQRRFGLRWWPLKRAKPLVKQFLADDPFVPVFQQSFTWLKEISAPARAVAKWYEENPKELFLPPELEHLRGKEILTVPEAASLRGTTAKYFLSARSWAKSRGIRPIRDPLTGKAGIRFSDMEKAVLADLPVGFPWFHEEKKIKYSDMLVLYLEGESHPNNSVSPTMFAKPTESSYYHLLDAMVDHHRCVEADGEPVRIRSHQFRHRNETVAYQAGVQRAWMNRHAGRARTSQEESYDDRQDAERMAQASVASVRVRVLGDLVLNEPNRPLTMAEITEQVEVLKRTGYRHVSDKGVCDHNFVDKPCTEFHDCLFCEDLICIKGVPIWEANIRMECAATEENLAHGMEAERLGLYGAKEHVQDLLLPRAMHCRQIMALLNDSAAKPGTVFRHAPKEDPYNPMINCLRHHAELGRKAGRDVAWVERSLSKLQGIREKREGRPLLSGGDSE